MNATTLLRHECQVDELIFKRCLVFIGFYINFLWLIVFEIVLFTARFLVGQTAENCKVCGFFFIKKFDYARARLGCTGNLEGDFVMRNKLHLSQSSCFDRVQIFIYGT